MSERYDMTKRSGRIADAVVRLVRMDAEISLMNETGVRTAHMRSPVLRALDEAAADLERALDGKD